MTHSPFRFSVAENQSYVLEGDDPIAEHYLFQVWPTP